MNRPDLSVSGYLRLLPGSLPLFCLLPTLIRAWTESRLDRLDWLFFVLFAGAFWHFTRRSSHTARPFTAGSILLCLLSFSGILLGLHMHINALLTLFCIFFWLSTIWFCQSWESALRLFPLFLMLCAGIPGSSYWLGTVLGLPSGVAFTLKCLFSLFCLCCSEALCRGSLPIPEPGACFFSILLIFSLLLLWQNSRFSILGHQFTPQFDLTAGSFHGVATTVSADTRRFFASSKVSQYLYLSPRGRQIHVLHIRCGSDVHEIHPASFCLKTSRWHLQEEPFRKIQNNFHVTEIIAEQHSRPHLIWVWYSNDILSTPSFLGFRKKFQFGKNWQVYQLSTPLNDDLGHARIVLQNFLQNLSESEQNANRQ